MSANTETKAGTNFPTELVKEMFTKVAGHSSIAKLSKETPIPFAGSTEFVFTMDGEAALVGEGAAKPAGDADYAPVVIRPVKVLYQHRVSDEFVNCSEEKQLAYLQAFADGFSKKIARALDIMAFHGVNPATKSDASFKATNSFDGLLTPTEIDIDDIDVELSTAISTLVGEDKTVTGIVFAPTASAKMGAIKVNGIPQYPEFAFGNNPDAFYGHGVDVNNTLAFDSSDDLALVGDFENAFKWGYAQDVTFEVIEFGNPDGGTYDLKQCNEVCLRSEAYIGWGILDDEAFALLAKETEAPDEEDDEDDEDVGGGDGAGGDVQG